jgi:hypothetical protein
MRGQSSPEEKEKQVALSFVIVAVVLTLIMIIVGILTDNLGIVVPVCLIRLLYEITISDTLLRFVVHDDE